MGESLHLKAVRSGKNYLTRSKLAFLTMTPFHEYYPQRDHVVANLVYAEGAACVLTYDGVPLFARDNMTVASPMASVVPSHPASYPARFSREVLHPTGFHRPAAWRSVSSAVMPDGGVPFWFMPPYSPIPGVPPYSPIVRFARTMLLLFGIRHVSLRRMDGPVACVFFVVDNLPLFPAMPYLFAAMPDTAVCKEADDEA